MSGAVSSQPVQSGVAVGDFAELVTDMSRLLTRLANAPLFKSAQIGLAEWVALSALEKKDGISNKQLAKHLGVTGQRANQITTSLSAAGLISVSQSREDSRKNVILIADSGRKKLEHVNAQLTPLLAAALNGREQLLKRARRNIKVLARVAQSETAPGQPA